MIFLTYYILFPEKAIGLHWCVAIMRCYGDDGAFIDNTFIKLK